jgi:hypothetical protein
MRILVISQFFAPDITAAAFRISETVELLRAMGEEVKVIVAEPHRALAGHPDETYTPENVFRVPIRAYGGGGKLDYIMHYLSFVLNAVRAGLRLTRSGWCVDDMG